MPLPHRGWLAVLIAPALLAAAATDPVPSWRTTLGRDHVLAGRIWDVAAASFVSPSALVDRLARGRFVLLGEKHDNPDHHQLQAWLLAGMVAAGRRPAIGFEMLTVAQAPALARYLATAPGDAAGLADAVDWKHSGWPDWSLYQPIADTALKARLRIIATNLAQSTVTAVRRDGVAALDPALVARYGLERPLAADTQAEMAEEIKAAHCGHGSDATIASLVTTQRVRDAHIADSLATGSEPDGAVLIAGFGHVRKDRGVPVYLRIARPGAIVVTMAFLEVERETTRPEDYAAGFGRPALPVDYVWFTPRVDDADPCEDFKASLEKLREKR